MSYGGTHTLECIDAHGNSLLSTLHFPSSASHASISSQAISLNLFEPLHTSGMRWLQLMNVGPIRLLSRGKSVNVSQEFGSKTKILDVVFRYICSRTSDDLPVAERSRMSLHLSRRE
jgi:hypothetical protein